MTKIITNNLVERGGVVLLLKPRRSCYMLYGNGVGDGNGYGYGDLATMTHERYARNLL